MFKIGINEHDEVAYVKIQIAAKAIHEAALLAYYCEGRKKQTFHDEMEREIEELLTLLGVDDRATARPRDRQRHQRHRRDAGVSYREPTC